MGTKNTSAQEPKQTYIRNIWKYENKHYLQLKY